MATKSWLRRSAEALADRLDRLRQNLDSLQERVREVVAENVGQTIGGAVRDAVQAVLAVPGQVPKMIPSSSWNHHPRPPSWQEPEERGWFREPQDRWEDERWEDDRLEDDGPVPQEPEPPRAKLPQALAAGCMATAWGVQRWKGPKALLVAVGLGLAATAVALMGGPWAAAALNLGHSLLYLFHLSSTAEAGRSVLAPS